MDSYNVPKKLPFSKKFLSAKVVLSYIFDYVIILVLIIAFYALDAVEPYHQRFSLRNYTLQYPYAVKERVPVPLLLIICVVAPAGVIAAYTLIIDGLFSSSGTKHKTYPFKKRLWELNCGILGLLLAVGASFVITGTLKNAIGKPRPDLIDRCQANATEILPFYYDGNYSLAGHEICRQENNAILKDGFRSFPSGHSSSSWAGLFYLSLYLTGKMHVLDSRGEVWKTFIVLIPTLGAALVAGSRIMDARHHPFDVLSGSLLGMLVAWASYRQYFPPLHDVRAKGRAYPVRTWGRSAEENHLANYQDDYNDRVPLRQDYPARPGAYATGRHSPADQERTGNVFQDEIRSSQRRRAQEQITASSTYSGVDRSQTDTPPHVNPPIPTSTTQAGFGRGASRRHFRRDDWDDSSDDDDARSDLELQHQYTLSRPSRDGHAQGHYDSTQNPFEGQDTSYSAQSGGAGGMPPKRLPSQRAAARVPDSVDESGDLASAAPPPPVHHEGTRGVQLVESYVPR
ncbi:PAP2-domain-containing protein [Tothia fuscella]|uniref:PAP2-domain-containing protein n=1 Tax=Tothia fuscella TaxID=1048955 RepID=A0A9P4U3M6_9PEZI|nr:PAP2-domain-containing protein [Tothia fuscella]